MSFFSGPAQLWVLNVPPEPNELGDRTVLAAIFAGFSAAHNPSPQGTPGGRLACRSACGSFPNGGNVRLVLRSETNDPALCRDERYCVAVLVVATNSRIHGTTQQSDAPAGRAAARAKPGRLAASTSAENAGIPGRGCIFVSPAFHIRPIVSFYVKTSLKLYYCSEN